MSPPDSRADAVFFQLVLGRAVDTDAVRRAWDGLTLAPAAGWLGSTGGVTADGRAVVAASFESANAARAVGDWSVTVAAALDPSTVLETDDVGVQRVSDASESKFVQLMRAAVRDRARFEAVEHQIGPAFIQHRPDFLEGYRLWLPDGTFVALDYFSSEAEARAGEAKAVPEDLATGFQEWFSQLVAPEWYDLVDPWLARPAT